MTLKNLAFALAIGLFGTILTGCQQEGPAERAGESMDRAGERAGEAMEDTGDKMEDAADKAEDAADK
jgi:hypothetical protein